MWTYPWLDANLDGEFGGEGLNPSLVSAGVQTKVGLNGQILAPVWTGSNKVVSRSTAPSKR